MHNFSETVLLATLAVLPSDAQAAFAFAAASRAQRIGAKEYSEEGNVLRTKSLRLAFAEISGATLTISSISLLLGSLENSPELDSDQMAACAYLLRFILLGDVQNVVWAARRSYEAADASAQQDLDFSSYTPEAEEAILGSSVVQLELASQASDLAFLQANPNGALLLAEQYATTI